MIRAGAMGGLALGGGDDVTGGLVGIEFSELPGREDIGLGRAGAEAVIRAADADGEPAHAVTDGGRVRADGARSICYSGHGSRAPIKLADPAPWVFTAPRGAIAFPAGQPGRTDRHCTKIHHGGTSRKTGKTAVFREKNAGALPKNHM